MENFLRVFFSYLPESLSPVQFVPPVRNWRRQGVTLSFLQGYPAPTMGGPKMTENKLANF